MDQTGTTAMELKLVALDEDDLDIVSTHLQDAVVKVADIHWRPAEKRLVMLLNRFDWEEAHCADPHFHRRRTALRFERVSACQCRHVTPHDKDAVLNLLAVEFAETGAPAGAVTLTFSGGCATAARGRMPRGRTRRSRPGLGDDRCVPGPSGRR